jgi:hypothetical protein
LAGLIESTWRRKQTGFSCLCPGSDNHNKDLNIFDGYGGVDLTEINKIGHTSE